MGARRRTLTRRAALLLTSMLATLVLTLGAARSADAVNFTVAQNADRQLGATSWISPAYDDGTKMNHGLYNPSGVAVDGSGSVYVADTNSNRIMRWAATPGTDGAAMSTVLMKASGSQQSWMSNCTNGSNEPEQVSAAGDGAAAKLAVADRYNDRVVLFAAEPTVDGTTGTVFLGQADGSSCSSDRGGAAAANTLDTPTGVWTDGTKVAVADSSNNRVLLWNAWPGTGQAAAVVLGQPDFVSTLPDRGGAAGQNTLENPKGVFFDGSYLYVTDSTNNRVLVWTGWPAVNGANANYVIGQADFTSSTNAGCTATGLWYPTSVSAVGSGATHQLAIAAELQHRVVIVNGFQAAPASTPTFALSLGQSSITSCQRNRNSNLVAADTLRSPGGIAFENATTIWVSDTGNHRVLRYVGSPLAQGQAANRVLGHAGATAFTAATPNDGTDDNVFFASSGATNAFTYGAVASVAPDGSVLVADPVQHALSIWTGGSPAIDNAPFGMRLGQTVRHLAGEGGASDNPSATNLCSPHGSWTDGTRVLLADSCNDRVLVWTTFPAGDGDPPDYVLGQVDFTSSASATTQARMDTPRGVTSDGTDVYVADTGNDRVIVYRNFWAAPANGKPADVLLGQTTWTNPSGATSSTRLNNPAGIDLDRNTLVVADHDNSRIAIWRSASTLVGGEPIDAVVGQPNATSSALGGIAEDTPDVALASNALMWVEDCRAFVLDPIPTTGFVTAAPPQIGTGCVGAPAQNALHSPASIDAQSGKVWISNSEHARIMRWTDTSAPTISVAPTATVRCDGTVTVNWSTSESTSTEIYWDSVTRGGVYTAYVNSSVDPEFTGLSHSGNLSFPTPGTKYAMVRAVDWNAQSVVSSEISFTVPATCPAPTTMLGDDANAQLGTGRSNPSATSAPAINSTTFHTSWLQSSGVTMDRFQTETWSTPPEHAGGLWHLDGSTAADPNSQNTNAVVWTGGPSYATGRFGSAIALDGSSQYGSVPSSASISAGSNFTAEAWFRTSDISNVAYPVVIMKSDVSGCGPGSACTYALHFNQAANAFCANSMRGASQYAQCRTAVGLVDGAWHHAAMTVDSTFNLRLFVDGVQAGAAVPIGGATATNASPLLIGKEAGGAGYFKGEVDDVRIAPVAYDAAAILGSYRTKRAHAVRVWDSTSTALGASCATATRCVDQTYAGDPAILREGARYWHRTRFNTVNNDYWSDWGLDWLETTTQSWLNISVPDANVDFGTSMPGTDRFASSTVQVRTNSASGYQLFARDQSDTWSMERSPGGPNIPDRQDGATPPAQWLLGTSGFFGVTVRSATGNRLAKWGTAPGGFAENDDANNLYTGLEGTSDVLLHERLTYDLATWDSVLLTFRVNASMAQAPGSYTGIMTVTAVASP